MSEHPYTKIKTELILRDHLAIDRTLLANETALLSYIRTTLTMLVAGVSLVHFFAGDSIIFLGWGLIVGSAVILVLGMYRSYANDKLLKQIVGHHTERTRVRHYQENLTHLWQNIFK